MRTKTAWSVLFILFFLISAGCGGFFTDNGRKAGNYGIQKENIRHSNLSVLTARGRFLLETRPHEKSLAEAGGKNFFSKRRYKAFQKEVKDTARQLHEAGVKEFEQKNFSLAEEALLISNRLSFDAEAGKYLSKIWKIRAAEYKKARDAEAAETEKKWAGLESKFRDSMQAGDLLGAKEIAGEMEKIDPRKAALRKSHLDRRIDWEVEARLSRGRMLYGQGYLRQAAEVWQTALELKPDDPALKQNISRAETFLENMDRWGGK